jgi:PIN domain nuclease of toxin-antitoxin system
MLLDTHVLVWLDEGSQRLGNQSLSSIDAALKDGELGVSVISFWEVAMLVNKGRLKIQMDLQLWRRSLLESGLQEIPLTGELAIYSALVDDFHGDPADRMIVATAQHLNAELVTADEKILSWKHELLRIDARC